MVYIQNKEGKPLMPTKNHGKVRKWLREGKAKVVKRKPFTIRMLIDLESEETQSLILGMDTGYGLFAISVVSDDKEVISIEAKLRRDVSNKVYTRSIYRRSRRCRKLRYREPRFLNRKGNDLSPSIKQKVQSHVGLIEFVKSILPVTEIRIEGTAFDIQKMNKPDIFGKGYQKGVQKDFENVKAYVLARGSHTCFYNKKSCGPELHVHHIIYRSKGGTDKPDNLITVCKTCHEKIHEGVLKLSMKKHRQFKDATFMNIVKKRLFKFFPEAVEVYGYETKVGRYELGVEKSHTNDAYVIAGGRLQERIQPYLVEFKRKNNRSLQKNRKGYNRSVRKCRYILQPKDIVKFDNREYKVIGTHSYGKFVKIMGKSGAILSKSTRVVEVLFHQKTVVW